MRSLIFLVFAVCGLSFSAPQDKLEVASKKPASTAAVAAVRELVTAFQSDESAKKQEVFKKHGQTLFDAFDMEYTRLSRFLKPSKQISAIQLSWSRMYEKQESHQLVNVPFQSLSKDGEHGKEETILLIVKLKLDATEETATWEIASIKCLNQSDRTYMYHNHLPSRFSEPPFFPLSLHGIYLYHNHLPFHHP